MLSFSPLIIQSAFSMSIHASVFVKMMDSSMKSDDEGWSQSKRDQYALLAMAGLGVGEIIGSIVYGRINDKFPIGVTIVANVLGSLLAFAVLIAYAIKYDFNLALSFPVTLTWGLQDSGLNNLINSVLGFQFDSKTTPFSVNKFVQSICICLIMAF